MDRIRNAREYHKALDEMDAIERFSQFNALPIFMRTKLLRLAEQIESFELSNMASADYVGRK